MHTSGASLPSHAGHGNVVRPVHIVLLVRLVHRAIVYTRVPRVHLGVEDLSARLTKRTDEPTITLTPVMLVIVMQGD